MVGTMELAAIAVLIVVVVWWLSEERPDRRV